MQTPKCIRCPLRMHTCIKDFKKIRYSKYAHIETFTRPTLPSHDARLHITEEVWKLPKQFQSEC